MQIGKILYPITTLGPGKRVGVWTVGCNRDCEGCSNPELKIFDAGNDTAAADAAKLVLSFRADGVTVSGGEPFLQAGELARFVEALVASGVTDILVYSGFTLAELRARRDADTDYVLSHIAALIDGPFVKALADGVPLRGSSNQKLYVFKPELEAAYARCMSEDRRVDIFRFGDETHFIGIPIAGSDALYADYVDAQISEKNNGDKKGQ